MNKPSFLKGIAETDEEKEIMSVLKDNPDPGGDEPKKDEPKGDEPKVDEPKGDEPKKDEPKGDEPKVDELKGDEPKKDEPKGDEPKKDEPKKDEPKGDEPKKDEPKADPVDVKFGTFKSGEEAEKAYKELQRTLTKLKDNQPKPGDSKKEIEKKEKESSKLIALAKTQQLVDVKIPKSGDYKLEGGNFDIEGFSRDLIKNTVLSIQQGLIGGKLGSMQFGLMSEAMGEEFAASQATIESGKNAKVIEGELLSEFPILKDNEEVSKLFERSVYGEFAKRQANTKDGEALEPLTKEDYFSIAKGLINNIKIEASPEKEETPDKPKLGSPMTPDKGKAPKEGTVEADIEGMMNSKKSSGSIF